MAAIGELGAAERIAQRLRPEQRLRLVADAQCRPAVTIDLGAFLLRQALEQVLEVGLDLGQLFLAQHVLEDVEAGAPVGLENIGMDLAVFGEADRPSIAQRIGALLALAQVFLPGRFFAAVIDRGGSIVWAHGILRRRSLLAAEEC